MFRGEECLKWKIAIMVTLAVLLAFGLFTPKQTWINVAYANGSSSGDINFVEIWQYNGSDYVLRANFTSSGTFLLYDSQPTKFMVNIKFNSTLAGSTNEAIECTKVIMNITGVWTNEEFNNTSCMLNGDFYYLVETGIWNEEGKPESGVTYECNVIYQGYY